MAEEKKSIGIPLPLRFVLSVVIIGLLFTQADLGTFIEHFFKADPMWLVVAIVMVFLEPAVLSATWSMALTGKGYHAPFREVFRISLASDFVGFIFPSSLGSDLMKVIGLSKYISNTAEALSSLFIIRILNYVWLFLLAAFTVFFFKGRLPDEPITGTIEHTFIAGFAVSLLGAVFMSRVLRLTKRFLLKINLHSVYKKIKKLYDVLMSYKENKVVLAKISVSGFILQINRIVYMYIIAMALGIDADPATFFVFVPIVTAMTLIPVSISGIGVREGGYVFLFSYAGVSVSEALGMSILGFALSLSTVLVGGIVYWISGFHSEKGALDSVARTTTE